MQRRPGSVCCPLTGNLYRPAFEQSGDPGAPPVVWVRDLERTSAGMQPSGAQGHEVPLTVHAPASLDPPQTQAARSLLAG